MTEMTGADMVIEALADQGVEHIFGYPGGAVLPIYDALFQQNKVQHILVRHEQGAVHAAEGYARSTGKVGTRAGDVRARRDQCSHRPDRCALRLHPARRHHRPGADPSDRQRRVPGMRHRRHHAAVHEIQLSRQKRRRPAARAARGVSYRLERPARAGRRRYSEGHSVRQRRLFQADRVPAQGLSAEAQGRCRQDQAGGRDDGGRQAPAVLYRRRRDQFRPARRANRCANWSSSPAFRSPRP